MSKVGCQLIHSDAPKHLPPYELSEAKEVQISDTFSLSSWGSDLTNINLDDSTEVAGNGGDDDDMVRVEELGEVQQRPSLEELESSSDEDEMEPIYCPVEYRG